MASTWYVMRLGGHAEGPLATETVLAEIREGRIGTTAYVCRPGHPWTPILFEAVFAAACRASGPTTFVPAPPPTPMPAPSRVTPTPPPTAAHIGDTLRASERGSVGPPQAWPVPIDATAGRPRARARTALAVAVTLGGAALVVGTLGALATVRGGASLGGQATRDGKIRQALVHVVAGASEGAGFFVKGPDTHAYVVTAYHVIESGAPVRVERWVEVSAKKSYVEAYPATDVVAVDPDADLAIIRLKEVDGSKFARLPLAKAPEKDQKIVAHGFPRSNLGKLESPTSAEGKVSVATRFGVVDRVAHKEVRASAIDGIIISAQLEPGYSGGPTVNEGGEVVGVNVMKDREHTQQSGAVSVEVLARLLGKLEPAAAAKPPTPEQVRTLLTTIEADYLKRKISDRMEVRETDFVSSDDLPTVGKLAAEVADMMRDTTPDEHHLTGRARLGFVFAGLSGRPLETRRAPEVVGALAPCPRQALSLFGGLRAGKDPEKPQKPTVDCDGYASRALAWDLTASVLSWEGTEHAFSVSGVEPVNDDAHTFKATVSARGTGHTFPVWVSTEQGRLRLKLFSEEGKPYWIERGGNAEASAFRGAWTYRATRQRISDRVPIDGKTTETIDVDVRTDGTVQVKHHFLREVYTPQAGATFRCNGKESAQVGIEQNFAGRFEDGVIRLAPTSMNGGAPVLAPAGSDAARCGRDMGQLLGASYTPDRLVVLKFVAGRLVMYRTDGSEFPEEVDFVRP